MGQTLDSSSPIEYTTNISRLVRSLSVLTVFWRTGEEESNVCPTTYSKPDQAWALNPASPTILMSMSMRKRSDNTASPSTGTAMSDMSAISSTMTSMAIMGSSTASVGTEDRTMSTMADMPQMALGPRGCSPPMMFRPGFNASSLPLETCTNTTSDFFTFTADASRGWTALHLVNAGAVSRLSVSLDGHSMFV